MGGEVYSQAEKAWTDEKYLETLKELKDKKKVSKKLLTELIGDWCAIYGPAIVTVKTKLKKGEIRKEEVPAELDKEIRLNRIAARVMSLIMKLGSVFIKCGGPQGMLIGGGLVLSAQPVSAGVKKAVRTKIEEGKIDEEEAFSTAVKALKKELNLKELFMGKDSMCILFGTNTDDPMIAELNIDGPGLADMLEVVGDDLISLDFKGLKKGVNPGSKLKYNNKVKRISAYYGTLSAIGDLMEQEAEQNRDQDFVAFFDIGNNTIGEIINGLFGDVDKEKGYKLFSFKEVDYAANVPRLIHTKYGKNGNQIIVYTHVEEKTAQEKREYAKNYNQKQYGWMTGETNSSRESLKVKESILYTKSTETAPKPYLQQLKKYCSPEYLKRLLKQGIEIGKGTDYLNHDYYQIVHISYLKELAGKYELDLEKDNVSYKDILNVPHNSSFVDKGLAGNLFDNDRDYDYMVLDVDLFLPNGHEFFQSTDDLLYGSAGRENNEGMGADFEFWSGIGYSRYYEKTKQEINPQKSKMLVNGKQIGDIKDLKREKWNRLFGKLYYTEKIEKEDGRVIELEYVYDQDIIGKNELTITYSLQSVQEQKREAAAVRIKGRKYPIQPPEEEDKIKIKGFANGDYGIYIPDKIGRLAGSRYGDELKKEDLELEAVKVVPSRCSPPPAGSRRFRER